MPTLSPRRIMVTGCCGAGKSTLARQLPRTLRPRIPEVRLQFSRYEKAGVAGVAGVKKVLFPVSAAVCYALCVLFLITKLKGAA